MALDNTEYEGQASRLLDLVRDLTMSGAKLPPIFAQMLQVHGQWIKASSTVGTALLTLGSAIFSFRKGLESLSNVIAKLNKEGDKKDAVEFARENRRGNKQAFLKARETYRETDGSDDDKMRAAQQVYRREATKDARKKVADARNDANALLEKIRSESEDAANEAAQRAYNDILQRARRARYRDPERLAERARRNAYRDTYHATRYSTQNTRMLTAAQNKVATATQNVVNAQRAAASVSRGGGFTGAIKPSMLSGASGAAIGLGLGIAVQAAYIYGRDWWEQWQKKKDAAMKSAMAQQTHLNKLMQTGVQQESQLRQATFKAEEEMDRKRFENLRILAESKTKMNEADLAMQERIQQVEKQRLAAQKQGELAKQQAGQMKEIVQQTFDYLKEEGRVQDTAHRRGGALAATWGWISNLTGGSFGGNLIEDERGRLLDDSIGQAVQRHGFLGRSKDRALQSIMATAAQARENAMQTVENDFKEHIARYEEFAATIAAAQVGSLAPELAAARKKLDDAEKKLLEYFQTHEQSIAVDRIAQMSFEEAKTSGKLKQDSVTGEYTIMDREGAIKVIHDESDWANYQSENRSGDAETYDRMTKANEESMKLQEKMVSYQQASVALVQEQVKKQEELLKNLRDAVAKNYESDMTGFFGPGNRKTSAEVREIMGNRSDEAFRDAVLASRAFAGNAQAAEEYKLNADIAIAGRRAYRKIDSDESREYLELYKKYQTELYSLQRKNIVEEHAMVMQNNTKIFQAYLDSIKQQREAYFRMLDKQLSIESTNANAFGRQTTEVMQDLQLNRIAQSFDQQKTDFESTVNIQKAASDAATAGSVTDYFLKNRAKKPLGAGVSLCGLAAVSPGPASRRIISSCSSAWAT